MFGENESQKELRGKWPTMSKDEKWDTFLWKLSWWHSHIHVPGSPSQPIWDLTAELKKASQSSEDLTKSIRNATWVAAVIGGLGVVVAIVSLLRSFGIL